MDHARTSNPAQPRRAAHGLVLLALLAAGCAGAPAARFDRQARALGFERHEIEGAAFRHAVFRRGGEPGAGALHLYLGGDGSPWLGGNRVAADPTPRDPLALRLMRADPAPSALLGRPCYHGVGSARCEPRLWTHQRYSETVLESLVAAARALMLELGAQELVLVGTSGGGVLAMLMAERLDETTAVVTVAANLDVAAWARLHGYSQLRGSLDPAGREPLSPSIRQLHLAGGRDGNVPPELIEGAIRRQPGAELRVYERYDHACCWDEVWPEVLDWLLGAEPGG